MSPIVTTREYDSPVREQQKADTKDRILAAVVRVVLEDGVHAFSVATVAERAGVSHRTVYRHYPTREALLEGVVDRLEDLALGGDPEEALASPDAMEASIRKTYASFEQYAEELRATIIASTALCTHVKHRRRRSDQMRRAAAARFPNLPAAEHRRAVTVIRVLVGSRNWYQLTNEENLTHAQALEAVVWAGRTLLADLDRRNKKAGGV